MRPAARSGIMNVMTCDHRLTARELGDRIVWVMQREDACYPCVAGHLGIEDVEFRRRLVGLESFTSLQLAMVSDYLKIRTSALFADTWAEFIVRQTTETSELDELKDLLWNLGYTRPQDPHETLATVAKAYVDGAVSSRVLVRGVQLLVPELEQ